MSTETGKVYGYRKLHEYLHDRGVRICPNRVARLTKLAGITAYFVYGPRLGKYGGRPSVVIDRSLDRSLDFQTPDRAWVTDIAYFRTQEGSACLAVVIDLFSRRVVRWSMQNRQTTDVVLQSLLMVA